MSQGPTPELELLEKTRAKVEAQLAEARRELEKLDRRRRELEAFIERADAALGGSDRAKPAVVTAQPAQERHTLHEAMAVVLGQRDNQWMSAYEIADQVNAQGLYQKRDGTPVDPSQIHSRANKYPLRFEKDGRRFVRLKIRHH